MRALLVGILLATACGARAAAGSAPGELRDLTSGRYELKIAGALCAACFRAVAFELKRHPAVESAKPALAEESVIVVIRSGKTLTVKDVRKALARAANTANLAAAYTVTSVRYELAPLNPKQ